MKKKNRLVQNLLVSVGSGIICFSILEIGTRLLWHGEVPKVHVGVILKDGNRKITQEGIQYNTNSRGLRNKEIQMEKPKGVKRILALGDSFIWGDGLPEEDLVVVKIENSLNKKNPQDIEVVNGGISGFNTTIGKIKPSQCAISIYC